MVYMFMFGPVAVTVRYWEERGDEVEAGARVEVRRAEEVVGTHDRPGAAGWRIGPVSDGGLWRCDLLTVIDPPNGEPRHHHHPAFCDGDVGRRVFDTELTSDPVGWTMAKLVDLPALLVSCGATDLAERVDTSAVERALPAVRSAIEACLHEQPQAHVTL